MVTSVARRLPTVGQAKAAPHRVVRTAFLGAG